MLGSVFRVQSFGCGFRLWVQGLGLALVVVWYVIFVRLTGFGLRVPAYAVLGFQWFKPNLRYDWAGIASLRGSGHGACLGA